MTTPNTQATIEVVPEVKKPIEPIFYNGIFPVFLSETPESLKEIKDQNHFCCFILGKIEEKGDKPGTSKYRDVLFQMMNGPLSYGLTEVSFDSLGVKGSIKESAYMKAPVMPWQFVEKMDMFFRAAHAKYGTESIIMLTYDMAKMHSENPGEGWDYYVPTQTNTASDCDYHKSEVLDILEGTSLILAGSAHSHPEMGAFFSDTDHKDQADWPGIHITFAWKKGDKVSSHHIELIQNNRHWSYDSEDSVFEQPPRPTIEHDFTAILEEKVSEKKATVTTVGYAGNAWNRGGTNAPGKQSGTKSHSGTNSGPLLTSPHIFLPEHAPDARQNVIVAAISRDANSCRFCTAPITPKMREYSSCYCCGSFFMYDDEDLEFMINQRNGLKLDTKCLLGPDPVYIWSVEVNDIGISEHVFELAAGGHDSTPKA